jgi:hypothetical protein
MESEIPEEVPEKWYKGPLKYIIGVFLIFLLVLWVVPHYGVKLDPEPDKIPALSDLGEFEAEVIESTEIGDFIVKDDPVIKNAATFIAAYGCSSGEKVCQAKAIYYFVRDEIDYVADPIGKEYWESATTVLANGGGDCESGAILMANLMEAIGIDVQVVFVSGHAFLRIYLPEALARYKQDDWVYLDWTCSKCDLGEISYKYADEEKRFVDV